GGQVMAFANETQPVKVPRDAKLSMPALNRGIIKDLGMVMPRVALAAPLAGTGIEISNIAPVLLLARCDKGRAGAVKGAAKTMGADAGDITVGGRKLNPREVEKLLTERLTAIEVKHLDKFAEIGVVSVETA